MTLFTMEVSKGSSSSASDPLEEGFTEFELSTGTFTESSVVRPFFGLARPAVPGATCFLQEERILECL